MNSNAESQVPSTLKSGGFRSADSTKTDTNGEALWYVVDGDRHYQQQDAPPAGALSTIVRAPAMSISIIFHLLLVLQSGVLESPLGHVNVRVPPPGSLPQLPVGEGEPVPGLSRSRPLGVRLLLVRQVQGTGDAQAGDDQVGWMAITL